VPRRSASAPRHGCFRCFPRAGTTCSATARSRPKLTWALPFAPTSACGSSADATLDALYVSRFDHDFLAYTQSRAGYDFGPVQLHWNGNVTIDAKRQDWANFVETGPGLRVPIAQSMY